MSRTRVEYYAVFYVRSANGGIIEALGTDGVLRLTGKLIFLGNAVPFVRDIAIKRKRLGFEIVKVTDGRWGHEIVLYPRELTIHAILG
jgi:hypothetical protein